MEYSLALQQVVNKLEKHEQITRIRKMLLCACKGVWENDPNKLNSFSIASLLKELKRKNPTPEELKISLYKILSRINKQGEYLAVAKTIFGSMKQLYDLDRELTKPQLVESEPSLSSSPNRLYPYPQTNSPVSPSQQKRSDRAYDSFGVRMEMMTYTNPLRAKIIIFSTIYRPFNFSNQDWLNLKLHELDDLTQALINNYDSLTEAEQKLKEAAQCIDDPEENKQTINAILQTIKSCYQHVDKTIVEEPDLDQTIVMDED